MALTNCSANTAEVSALADEPALTSAELKAVFDASANNVKNWINDTHLPQLEAALEAKQDALGLEAGMSVITDSEGKLTEGGATSRELGYLSGVEAALQTQLNAKQKSIGFGTTTPQGGEDGDIYLQYS